MKVILRLFLSTYWFIILGCMISADVSAQADLHSSVEYRSIGPFRGGRSCAVTGVPGKPNLYYFGATGGGVWKTTDGGRSWSNISDGYFGGSVGSIAVANTDHNVIYVGGGEKTVRGNVSFGYGVWKTENGGKTWEQKGLKQSRHVARVRVHPNDHNTVFAAVMGDLYKPTQERGVYKSTDGGSTWRRVLFANENAGAVDLIIDPTNHRILYATTWNVRRTPYSLSSGGEGSALWKSTDGGETWTNISDHEGLPDGTWGISGVTVSPLNGDRLWAIIESKDGGVYRSNDAGETWTKVNGKRALRQRAWYYTRIYADTEDEDAVYVMNVSYHKSTDGGRTFKSKRAPHGDHHDLWIAPEDANRMIIGDDGGAQVTYDDGETWSTYHNQPTSQFYRVTVDDHFPYRIYVAQQDNSTLRIPHRTTGGRIDDSDWESTAGGESAHIAVDPLDNDIVYGGSYGGFLTRRNHRTNTVRAVNVWPDNPMGHGAEGMKYRFQWNFPIFFSKHNPKKLYTTSQHLHVSTDEGHSWKTISPDLTRNEEEKLVSSGGPITKDNTGVEYYATIFAAAESPLQEGMIWVGSDDGRIHVTKDGGDNWEDITSSKMPKYLMINSVEPSVHDAGTCYVAGTLYKAGDYSPYLYKTTDYGKSWKLITKGIGVEHFTRVLREDPIVKGILYAGTESGAYISYDDGKSWQSFQKNLPIVPITDMVVKNNNLILSTQGRGIWLIDDLSVLHQCAADAADQTRLYRPLDSYRMPGWQSKSKSSGQNHPGGVMTHFYLKDYEQGKDSVTLTYTTAAGDTIKSYSTYDSDNKLKVEKGGNMFVWDMHYPKAKSFDGMILWWGSLRGPKAAPGDYTVTLEVNGVSQSQNFKILKKPEEETTEEDVIAQVEFIKGINDKLDEAHQSIIDMRSLRKQIKSYSKLVDQDDINDYVTEMDSVMTEIEQELYQTKNRSGQDPLNFPIRLTNKLAHLNSLTQMGGSDFPPTNAAVAVRDELVQLIDDQLQKWTTVKHVMLPKLNALIKSKDVDVIILKDE